MRDIVTVNVLVACCLLFVREMVKNEKFLSNVCGCMISRALPRDLKVGKTLEYLFIFSNLNDCYSHAKTQQLINLSTLTPGRFVGIFVSHPLCNFR